MKQIPLFIIRTTFSDYREFPSDLNKLLSFMPFEPTRIWKKGERILLKDKLSEAKYNNSTWQYQECFEYSVDIVFDDVVKEFLKKIYPYKKELFSLKLNTNMEFDLSILYSQEDIHNGFVFNQVILSILKDLNFDLSIYPSSRKIIENLCQYYSR